MKYLLRFIFIGFVISTLTACSNVSRITETIYGEKGLIKDHGHDYKKSYSVPALKIPKNLRATHIDDYYQVPAVQHGQHINNKVPVSTLPPGSSVAKKEYKKQIHEHTTEGQHQIVSYASSDQYKLLLTYATPLSHAWQDVRQALHNGGYKVMDEKENSHTFYILHAPGQVSNIMSGHMKRYQVRVLDGGRISFIVVTNEGGTHADYMVVKGVLKDIRNYILMLSGVTT